MWNSWVTRWQTTLAMIERLGGEGKGLQIGKPASEQQIERVEQKLGLRLPESFRETLLDFSGHVDFGWNLNDCIKLPGALKSISSGECFWNIDNLPEIEESRKDWVRECFSDPDDDYDRVWHNKLAFMSVANGDAIAFDLDMHPDCAPVVYLSHDDGEGHGYILGRDFKDFIDRWTLLGCPGTEDWQMMPFLETMTGGINTDCQNALEWRRLIGLGK